MDKSVRSSLNPAVELRANRAFVVQFSNPSDFAGERLIGRIEHITSGQAKWFFSMDEMMCFVSRVLAEAEVS